MKASAVVLLIVLFSGVCSSQINISMYGGLNSPVVSSFSHTNDILALYWKDGLSIGLMLDVPVSKSIGIVSGFEYNSYSFDHYVYTGAHIPEDRFVYATGEPSSSYNISVMGMHFWKLNSWMTGHFMTGVGYVVEKIGNITQDWESMNGPPARFATSFESAKYAAHIVGLGFRFHFTESLGSMFSENIIPITRISFIHRSMSGLPILSSTKHITRPTHPIQT